MNNEFHLRRVKRAVQCFMRVSAQIYNDINSAGSALPPLHIITGKFGI